jgi:hypothetical protein
LGESLVEDIAELAQHFFVLAAAKTWLPTSKAGKRLDGSTFQPAGFEVTALNLSGSEPLQAVCWCCYPIPRHSLRRLLGASRQNFCK